MKPLTGQLLLSPTRLLGKAGVTLIPDILANSGGVLVSYFEWVQNLSRDHWSEEQVNGRLEQKMVHSFNEVVALAEKLGVDQRRAALVLAVSRVVGSNEALRLALKGHFHPHPDDVLEFPFHS